MTWQQLTAQVPRGKVPEIESLLELAGAVSIALEDGAGVPLFEPAPGDTPLWPTVFVKALFASAVDRERIRALLRTSLGTDAELTVQTLSEADFATGSAFAPLRVGRGLWVISADETAPNDGAAVLKLHRGLAFGTGQHPTTALCLEWIESSLEPGSVVLDFGCGSGILALAALRLGASRAFAVDSDPQALAATERNAALNGLERKIWVGPVDALPAFRADVLLANVLARPLMVRAAFFAERLIGGGRVVLSGVLSSQRPDVESAYAPYFHIDAVHEREGWIRLDAHKRIASC